MARTDEYGELIDDRTAEDMFVVLFLYSLEFNLFF